MSDVSGQLSSFWPFEAVITAVDETSGKLTVHQGTQSAGSSHVIPALYYGGIKDSGLFRHPDVGDRVLCVRVHPGSRGTIQAIKLLPKSLDADGKEAPVGGGNFIPAATTNYPLKTLGSDDIKLLSFGGGQIGFTGTATNNKVFIGNDQRGGMYVTLKGTDSKVTTVAHTVQQVSSGVRIISGDVVRMPGGSSDESAATSTGHELLVYDRLTDGRTRGLWPGGEAITVAANKRKRNPPISEYRMVINEVSEHAAYTGWDKEHTMSGARIPPKFTSEGSIRAIAKRGSLYMAPHQLVEIIGGNVVNHRGEVLDSNYGVITVGDENGMIPAEVSPVDYEKARLITRRGIGYHFQLSTNSRSYDKPNDQDNFVYSIDKEGVLKLNVPRSSKSGNIPYPTNAFFNRASGGTLSTPDVDCQTRSEKIPVTLRNDENDIVFPQTTAASSVLADTSEDVPVSRQTGIRYTNSDNYFHNVKPVSDNLAGAAIRINHTKHHNMYAAAEMLIANTIQNSAIPFTTASCDGIILGNSVGQPFEKRQKDIDGDGTDPNEVFFMSTVAVTPGPPAMDPGGGVVVAGKDYTLGRDPNDAAINVPYTNSFSVSSADDKFSSKVTDESGETRRSAGGKSANLNFEGAIDISVGKDDHDQKSIVLDTAGSLVAWFGSDANGRSVVVQTDGDVAVNVGGRTGDSFNPGRFDLRVNVTDKGWVGDDKFVPKGGNHASDYIISISDSGLVIAGMNPTAPMIIRNDGNLTIEATAKLILAANSIEMREANRSPKPTNLSHTQADPACAPTKDPLAAFENVQDKIKCIQDLIADLTDTE